MGELKTLTNEAKDRWRWDKARSGFSCTSPKDPPLLAPLRALGRQLAPAEEGILYMIVEGGAWTQADLFAKRFTTSDKCQLCGEVGSYGHRCFSCPASSSFRDDWVPSRAATQCIGEAAPDSCLWVRLLLADPTWAVPRPIAREEVIWKIRPPGGCLDEFGFGDGSILCGGFKRTARGGWGLSVQNDQRQETAKLCGPVPGWHQYITLAELWAFWAYVAPTLDRWVVCSSQTARIW